MTRALVVVDIQNDYFPGGANPLDGPEAAAGTGRERCSTPSGHPASR